MLQKGKHPLHANKYLIKQHSSVKMAEPVDPAEHSKAEKALLGMTKRQACKGRKSQGLLAYE
jgi:hypothetical protein